MRRVACAEREPEEPRRVGSLGGVVGEEANRAVDEIGRQMIAAPERTRWIDARVVDHQLRCVVIGFGIHEAIEAIETAPERPAVERACRSGLGQRRNVPFSDYVVAIAMGAQDLGERSGFLCDLAPIAWKTAVEIGQAPDPD